jgi:hypothetical protein
MQQLAKEIMTRESCSVYCSRAAFGSTSFERSTPAYHSFLKGGQNGVYTMKRLTSIMVILLLSGGGAFAKNNHVGMRLRNNPTSQPSNAATVGHGAGMNPTNSQDLSGRSNPQDLTRSEASNPESLTGR